jgi:hypothetical protein
MIHWFIGSPNQSRIDSLIHCFTESSRHWLIGWWVHWFRMVYWFIDWLVGWLIDSSIHWLTGWLLHWVIASLLHWFIDSWVHCFIHSFIGSSISWFIDSFIKLYTYFFMTFHWHLNHHFLMHWCTSELQHFIAALKNLSIGHWFPIAMSYVRNFCTGVCRALSGNCVITDPLRKKTVAKGCPLLDISSHLTSDHRKPQLDTRWCGCGCPPIIFASSNLPELWIKSTVNPRWPPRPTHLANNIPLNFIDSSYSF